MRDLWRQPWLNLHRRGLGCFFFFHACPFNLLICCFEKKMSAAWSQFRGLTSSTFNCFRKIWKIWFISVSLFIFFFWCTDKWVSKAIQGLDSDFHSWFFSSRAFPLSDAGGDRNEFLSRFAGTVICDFGTKASLGGLFRNLSHTHSFYSRFTSDLAFHGCIFCLQNSSFLDETWQLPVSGFRGPF